MVYHWRVVEPLQVPSFKKVEMPFLAQLVASFPEVRSGCRTHFNSETTGKSVL